MGRSIDLGIDSGVVSDKRPPIGRNINSDIDTDIGSPVDPFMDIRPGKGSPMDPFIHSGTRPPVGLNINMGGDMDHGQRHGPPMGPLLGFYSGMETHSLVLG